MLAACGFEPVYAPGAPSDDLRGRIVVASPADEEGFALVKQLEDRLGRPNGADLALTADIYVSEQAVGFLPDGTISRYNVVGRVDWALTDSAGVNVTGGDEQAFASYSATSTNVATTFAQRDARRRLMVILADRIVADILAADLP